MSWRLKSFQLEDVIKHAPFQQILNGRVVFKRCFNKILSCKKLFSTIKKYSFQLSIAILHMAPFLKTKKARFTKQSLL